MRQWCKRFLKIVVALLVAQGIARVWVLLRPWPTPLFFAPMLRSAARRSYRKPEPTLAPLALEAGMSALEIGPGTGLFTEPASHAVGPSGLLVGVDIQRGMLRQIRHVQLERPHVALMAGDAACLPLNASCFDAAFLIAVLPMVPDRHAALRELRRVLRPGAKLLVSEDLLAPEYVPLFVTEHWLRRAGFRVVKRMPGFWCYSVLAVRE